MKYAPQIKLEDVKVGDTIRYTREGKVTRAQGDRLHVAIAGTSSHLELIITQKYPVTIELLDRPVVVPEEPVNGTIVIDKDGMAWQRRDSAASDASRWFSTGVSVRHWSTLHEAYGPLTVVHGVTV